MMERDNVGFFTQSESSINGRKVWHYLVSTPIGQINVVQYEQGGKKMHEIKTFLFEERYDAAERKYASIVKGILSGKL